MPLPPLRSVTVRFWELVAEGIRPQEAGLAVGVSRASGRLWFVNAGGVRPRFVSPATGSADSDGPFPLRAAGRRPRLSLAEREEISVGVATGESVNSIARRLGRQPSTIWREIKRNGGSSTRPGFGPGVASYRRHERIGASRAGPPSKPVYRAVTAQKRSEKRAVRPKPRKVSQQNPGLHELVRERLVNLQHSPEQISATLKLEYPDRAEMQVSPEAIYQAVYDSIYLQGRGTLRADLKSCLRTGRALRRPRRQPGHRHNQVKGMVNISERPTEVADRVIPGDWEGDLIVGANNGSAIGTLVERVSGFVMLVPLPGSHTADMVAEAMIPILQTLPQALRRTLTWDQGVEMAQHARIAMATDMDIYFCDPHSPWQRGSNENTNGLLRQYFPKGTDLSGYAPDYLQFVADKLNTRPRKRHGFQTPTRVLDKLLSNPPAVASTA